MYFEKMKAEILQQVDKDKANPAIWGCGMQLKDIVDGDETLAKIVCEDFAAGLTVQNCESEMKKYALAYRNDFTVEKAEEIIRKFFGLGSGTEEKQNKPKSIGVIDLAQFL